LKNIQLGGGGQNFSPIIDDWLDYWEWVNGMCAGWDT
jgi:hypothetical protein